MDERRKWKNINTEEGRRNYRRLRNELKRTTEKAKKEYLENTCTEIMEFDVHEDKKARLEGEPRDSKYWY